VARAAAIAAAIAVSLLAVSGAGGAATQQTPKRGGTIVLLAGVEPRCVNPVDEDCAPPGLLERVLEPAFAVAPDFALRPQLVRSVRYTTTAPFTITFEIRPEARWNDGVPVTGRDFAFTHHAIVENLPPDVQGPHRIVRSIRPVGAKTVKVVLRSRTADWRTLFPHVMPWHALRGQDLGSVWREEITNPRTGGAIGSGPFLLQSWEHGRQMTFVRNPRYWGPHAAYLDRIVVRFCRCSPLLPQSAETIATLRQGEADLVFTRDIAILSQLRSIPGVRFLPLRLSGVNYLHLRLGPGGHPALQGNNEGKLVRRALAYGIDREAIARTVFGALDPRYPASNSAVFFNTHAAYRPNWETYGYRPANARRLLEQAGCRRGSDEIYVCAGERLSLRLSGIAGVAFRARTLDLIQRYLRQVGVDVQLSFSPQQIFFDEIVAKSAFQAAEFAWFNADGVGASVYGCDRDQNYIGYCQRVATRDLDQSDRILDAEQRARVLNRVDRQLAKDVPVIPLYQPPSLIVFRAALRNVSVGFSNVEDWWLDR
jgi:peptide/nickel transport system substrate-binding protein